MKEARRPTPEIGMRMKNFGKALVFRRQYLQNASTPHSPASTVMKMAKAHRRLIILGGS